MENCASRAWQITRRFYFVFFACMLIASSARAADSNVAEAQVPAANYLQSKPNRCVALHQGQVCYQSIQLLWHTDKVGDYCIYQLQAETPLHCWQGIREGEYRYAFASEAPVQLRLVNMHTNTHLAETTIGVAWVYKTSSRRKTHWRLF